MYYFRFHSRNAENWYRSDKDRYDYDYDDRALMEWIEALRRNESRSDRVLLLFNNCQRSQAAGNAHRMRELLSRMATRMEIVEPFAGPPSGSQQRPLCD